MPVYKNKDNGTWYVLTRYVDWKGERKQKCKRGFETKREAQEWERVFKQQSAADMDMNFSAFVGMLYGYKKKDRIFPISKNYLHREMDRGSRAAGVKRIRIHDLRHSHISLLIDMGFSAVAIADRVGHESIEITYRYAHLFPSKQTEMAKKLEYERMDIENVR